MTATATIKEQIQQLIIEVIPDITLEELAEESDIFSLGLDSINAMTLISNLQDQFNFQLETDEINFENFQNVDSILAMVQAKKV